MTTHERIAAIRARLAHATVGDWVLEVQPTTVPRPVGISCYQRGRFSAVVAAFDQRDPPTGADAALLGNAKADLEFLLSLVEEAGWG
jgi:hypothetical protein